MSHPPPPPRISRSDNVEGNILARALKRPAKENLERLVNYARIFLRNTRHLVRRTYTTYASFGTLCHLVIRVIARVVPPTTLYRALGIWPFLPIRYDQFKIWGRLDPPVSAYLKSQPRSNHPDNIPWKSFGRMLPEERMGYVVEVENGMALSNGITLYHCGRTIMGASHRYKSFRRPPDQKVVFSRSRKTSFQNQLERLGPLAIKPWGQH